MSGGEKKKKSNRTQGWEEAGSEFYQESYPGEHELEALQRDPKRLATLLPSKQTRVAAATIRIRTNDTRTNRSTVRRYTASRSRRDSTVPRRQSVTGDVQVSILPDLSEMKATEQTAWEEVMELKALPIPMSQKKEMKMKILNEPNFRLQGLEQFKWKRRKIWRRLQSKIKESYQNVELWKGSLKRIEGIFGTGVVTFFLFVKWLFLLNLFIFSIIFLFVTLPTILLDTNDRSCETNGNISDCCAQEYFNDSSSDNFVLLDLIQGTGFLERTVLYYGIYSNKIFHYLANETNMYYNVPLAYIVLTLIYFVISLVSIVRGAAQGFRERLLEGEGQFYQYCNLVFSSWDFCIHNEKAAKAKHKAIYREIKTNLETEKLEEERQSRTRDERYKIFFIRFVVNTLVLTILILCGCAIYFVFQLCTKWLDDHSIMDIERLFFEFLPSITMVFLNMLVPFLFRFLTTFENYSPIVVIWLILIRTVLLRLSSLIVLYFSLYSKITCDKEEKDEDICYNTACEVPVCWETYVGQQIYKLLLTDFATHIIITFFVNFLRSIIARHVENKFFKLIGEQTFDLPKHVLDVIYTQTLCWVGIFYAPLISALAAIIFFFLFYIKKFACLINSKPSTVIYRTSRSNAMFMLILLVSYIVAIIPIAFSMSELVPSKSCGPFRGKESVWSLIIETFQQTPKWIQDVIFFLSTAGFAIPLFIILMLTLYYYVAVNSANRHMVVVLKNQLVLEGHDKQFLLNRLGQFIKHENQKRQRLAEQMREGDKNYSR